MERFHWTIEEFEAQPWDQIELFLDIMNIEEQFKNRKNNEGQRSKN